LLCKEDDDVGLLFNLLTLPITGPLKGTVWVAEQVLDVAERDFYDEDAIRRQIQDVEATHRAGAMSDEEYEAAVDVLLQRLIDARDYRAMKG
jgi:hypothetical protein